MEILDLIDKLENMITDGRKMPMVQRSVIDPQKILEMVDQMRLAIPQTIQDAQEVLERREQIMNQALKDAQRIKSAAETEARIRVAEGELVKDGKSQADVLLEEAQAKAERLLEQVRREARHRREGADHYAKEVLAKLEHEVTSILSSVQHGQSALGHETPTHAA